MILSHTFAMIIGQSMMVIGLGVLLNPDVYQKVVEEFRKSEGLRYFGGWLGVVLGVTFISVHNIWGWHWSVIITVMGWIWFIEGVYFTLFPKLAKQFLEAYQLGDPACRIVGAFSLGLGSALTFLGYMY